MASTLLVLQAMSATSSKSAVGERAAWIEEHKVGWRLGPLREHVKRHGVVQTGYELVLFGRFHPTGRDDYEAARTLHEGLRALALEALGPGPPDLVLSVLPINRVVVPAEKGSGVEVELTVTGSPTRSGQPPDPAEARQSIAALEARLRAMGLRKA
jgi:hypothetical protein